MRSQAPAVTPNQPTPTPEWIAARLWQLRYVKDARASTRTLRITEAPDAAFARKKLAELRAKSDRGTEPAATAATGTAAAAAAAADADAAAPSEDDMLARRLLARLPRSLAATWLEESELDRDPVLPQGREVAAMRVALHEKTARLRARLGDLELRERERAATECDDQGACLYSSLLCTHPNRLQCSPELRESGKQLRAATVDGASTGGRLRPEAAWDAMARSRAARAAAQRVLPAAEEGAEVEAGVAARGGGGAGADGEAVARAGAEGAGEGEVAAGTVPAVRLGEEAALELLQRSTSLRRWAWATGLGGGGDSGSDGGSEGRGGESGRGDEGGSESGGGDGSESGDGHCPGAAAAAEAVGEAAAEAEVWTAAVWERSERHGAIMARRAAPTSVGAPVAGAPGTEPAQGEGALQAAAAAVEGTEGTERALRAVAAGALALGDPEAAQARAAAHLA